MSDRSRESLNKRYEQVERAAEQWRSQLIDVSGRNQLLFYRDLKVGTLDLATADSTALDALLAGRKVTVSRLFGPAALPEAQIGG